MIAALYHTIHTCYSNSAATSTLNTSLDRRHANIFSSIFWKVSYFSIVQTSYKSINKTNLRIWKSLRPGSSNCSSRSQKTGSRPKVVSRSRRWRDMGLRWDRRYIQGQISHCDGGVLETPLLSNSADVAPNLHSHRTRWRRSNTCVGGRSWGKWTSQT